MRHFNGGTVITYNVPVLAARRSPAGSHYRPLTNNLEKGQSLAKSMPSLMMMEKTTKMNDTSIIWQQTAKLFYPVYTRNFNHFNN